MNNEDLRAARIIEAKRRWIEDETPRREVEHLADIYETNWTPPDPVSDDVLAMRAWLKDNTAHIGPYVDGGSADGVSQARAYLAGCTRGREGAKGLVEAFERLTIHSRHLAEGVLSGAVLTAFSRSIFAAEAALASAKRGG